MKGWFTAVLSWSSATELLRRFGSVQAEDAVPEKLLSKLKK